MPEFNLQLKTMVIVDAIDHEDAMAKARSILDTSKAKKILMHGIEIAAIQ